MTDSAPRLLHHVSLGAMPYAESLALQRSVARGRISGALDQDVLLLVEHPHVITLGRSSKAGHLLATAESLARRGVELFEVERGGDATYHGPGQVVGYPILSLRRHKLDLHWYLRSVEAALIAALDRLGVAASRKAGYTGVWVGGETVADHVGSHPDSVPMQAMAPPPGSSVADGTYAGGPSRSFSPRKIASIGVHARDWVTWHGFAVNVSTDLSFFDLIVPCGIAGVEMTSVSRELGVPADVGATTLSTVDALGEALDLEPRSLSLDELRERVDLETCGVPR